MAFLNCTFFWIYLERCMIYAYYIVHMQYTHHPLNIIYVNFCSTTQQQYVRCHILYYKMMNFNLSRLMVNSECLFLKTFILEYLMLTILKVVSIQMCYQCLYVTLYKGVSFCLTPYHAPEILNWQKKGWWWQNFQEICCSKVIKTPFFPLMLLQFLYLLSYNYNVWQSITQNLAPDVKSSQYGIRIGL